MPLDYLSIGRTAMASFRLGMNVAGYNIANVNTEGFSRREIALQPLGMVDVRNGLLGAGIDVVSVRRVRDPFIDAASREAMGRMGEDSGMAEILSGIEPVLGDTENAVVTGALSGLFDAFESLTMQPDSPAVRADVVARAADLAATLRRVDEGLADTQRHADSRIVSTVERVNTILGALKQMNVDILQQEANGVQASDLRDQRDRLIDELSGLVSVRTIESEDGQLTVSLAATGDTLLSSVTARPLQMSTDADGLTHVVVDRGGEAVDVTGRLEGGLLGGLLKARDQDVARYRATLDALATSVIEEFNAIQAAGFDQTGAAGLALFIPDPPGAHAAGAIQVNPLVAGDGRRIAAASAPSEASNNTNAQAFLALRERGLAALGGRTLVAFSSDLIASLGRDVRTAEDAYDAGTMIVESFQQRRKQVSGVSLDEEASNLVKWQQSFQAAAQFLKITNDIVNQTLDALTR